MVESGSLSLANTPKRCMDGIDHLRNTRRAPQIGFCAAGLASPPARPRPRPPTPLPCSRVTVKTGTTLLLPTKRQSHASRRLWPTKRIPSTSGTCADPGASPRAHHSPSWPPPPLAPRRTAPLAAGGDGPTTTAAKKKRGEGSVAIGAVSAFLQRQTPPHQHNALRYRGRRGNLSGLHVHFVGPARRGSASGSAGRWRWSEKGSVY